ncbi:MAG TPA: Hpt domain-containing protein, partial [Nitrospirota bacterium]
MAGSLDKSGIIEFFLVEAGEHIQSLNKGLLSLEKDPTNTAMIDELFRAAHTLKGSAAMMGFQGVSDVAHKAEDMLGQFRSGNFPIRKETLNFLFDSVDAVKLMVDGIAANQPEDQLVVESIGQAYKDIVDSLPKVATGATPEEDLFAQPAPKTETEPQKDDLDLAWERAFQEEAAAVPVEPLSEEEVETSPAVVVPEELADDSAPEESPVAVVQEEPTPPTEPPVAAAPVAEPPEETPQPTDVVPLRQEIEEAKKSGLHEKRGTGRRATDAAEVEKQFIRVNVDRLDNLMNLVGE